MVPVRHGLPQRVWMFTRGVSSIPSAPRSVSARAGVRARCVIYSQSATVCLSARGCAREVSSIPRALRSACAHAGVRLRCGAVCARAILRAARAKAGPRWRTMRNDDTEKEDGARALSPPRILVLLCSSLAISLTPRHHRFREIAPPPFSLSVSLFALPPRRLLPRSHLYMYISLSVSLSPSPVPSHPAACALRTSLPLPPPIPPWSNMRRCGSSARAARP